MHEAKEFSMSQGRFQPLERKLREKTKTRSHSERQKSRTGELFWAATGDINIDYVYVMFSRAISSGPISQHK